MERGENGEGVHQTSIAHVARMRERVVSYKTQSRQIERHGRQQEEAFDSCKQRSKTAASSCLPKVWRDASRSIVKPVEASWSGNLHVNIATLVVLLYIYPPYLSKWVKSSLNLASLSLDCEPLCLFALLSLFLAKNTVTNFILTFCWFLLFIAAHFGSLVKIGYPPFRPFCKKPERIGPERLVFLFAFLSFNWVFLICTSSDEHSIPFSLWMHLCRVGFVTKARNRRRYCHFVEEWYIYETPVKAGCVLYCL